MRGEGGREGGREETTCLYMDVSHTVDLLIGDYESKTVVLLR